jgi:hypothetical protein
MQAVLLGSTDLRLPLKRSKVRSTQATSGMFSTTLLFSLFLKHDLTKIVPSPEDIETPLLVSSYPNN